MIYNSKKSFYLIAQLHGLFLFVKLTREVLQVKKNYYW